MFTRTTLSMFFVVLLIASVSGCRRAETAGPRIQPTATPTPRSTPLPTLEPTPEPGSADNPITIGVVDPEPARRTIRAASSLAATLSDASGLDLTVELLASTADAVAALCSASSGRLTAAWVDALGYAAIRALDCGTPELWAEVRQWHIVDFRAAQPLGTFPSAVDLLGDGSVFVIDGCGPTPGTMMVLARLSERALLWTGDVVPTHAGLRRAAEPQGLWDANQWWVRFWQAKRLRELAPQVEILPAFDTSGYEGKTASVRFHPLPMPVASPTRRPTPNRWERILPRPW
jgi:hypothetical protein